MSKTATGSFVIEAHGPDLIDGWTGGSLGRMRFVKKFTGEVAGDSVVEALTLGVAGGGPMVYVAIERFAGSLAGLDGTFLISHSADQHAGQAYANYRIVPGSGTGALAGLTGSVEITPEHNVVVRYELPD